MRFTEFMLTGGFVATEASELGTLERRKGS
jgi:hypothetical protein